MSIHLSQYSKYLLVRHIRLTLAILGLFLLSQTRLHAAATIEAYAGEPFGVGKVTIDVFRGEPSIPLSDERFTIWQEENRTMYPVVKEERAKQILREILPVKLGRKVTIYFLFQGSDPFDLSVFSPVEQAIRVKPIANVSRHRRLLNDWWKQYSGRWKRLSRDKEFPPVAENFLTVSLARRLGLQLPKLGGGLLSADQATGASVLDLFAGEAYHLQVDRAMLQDQPPSDQPLQPLPISPSWQVLHVEPVDAAQLAIEPIASYVPEECFYVRFGKFLNYLWFRDLNQKWQGDLQNMINRRGIDRASAKRTEQQLSLKYNAMAKILGPQVVEDLALIGLDPYVVDGAAIGVLVQAKNNFLLSQDLMRQRRGALSKFEDATEATVKIAGQDVSYISTPGGEVRSYYAQMDSFHLVTTSATLAKRFIEAGQGDRSLASLPSFQQARVRMSSTRDDTVFVFVPEKFYQNLCSPHYRIETARRVQSAREPILLELAGYASVTENQPLVDQTDLIAAGYLPAGFAHRVDGSSLQVTDGKVVDTLRGTPGFFVPVADMEVNQVSASEAAQYASFVSEYKKNVGHMPPMAVAVSRQQSSDNLVTMSVDVLIEPISGTKLEEARKWLSDEPAIQRLNRVEGDVLALEAAVQGGAFGGGDDQPYHVFGALRDFRSPLTINDGQLRPDGDRIQLIRAYIGTWPRPGILDSFVGPNLTAQPEQVAGGPIIGPTWQAKQNDFLLLSLKPDVINEVMPQLKIVDAPRPAQFWLTIDDLTGKQLSDTVNTIGYMRTREACVAACRLMNSLANQFRIDRSQCRELAERLVDGKFLCPLGGEYQLFAPERDLEVWVSTALPPENRFLFAKVPEDYRLPLLDWFRGLRADAGYEGDSIRAHLELDIAADAVPQ